MVAKQGKFFLGSDSAPHPVEAKKGKGKTAAGCFTQPHVTALVVEALEQGVSKGWIEKDSVTVDALNNFCSKRGRQFYGVPIRNDDKLQRIILEKEKGRVERSLKSSDGAIEIVPFRGGEAIRTLRWETS